MTTADPSPFIVDLNDLTGSGPVQLSSFPDTVAQWDVSPYQNQHVQIKGCAPTWAHLLVAGRLFPVAARLEFLLDDGKAGKPVPVFSK